MEHLHLSGDIDISGTAAGTVALPVPFIDRHPYGEVSPSREERYMHACEKVRKVRSAVAFIAEITIRSQFQAQMVIGQSVVHLRYRESIGSELRRRAIRCPAERRRKE